MLPLAADLVPAGNGHTGLFEDGTEVVGQQEQLLNPQCPSSMAAKRSGVLPVDLANMDIEPICHLEIFIYNFWNTEDNFHCAI